MLDAAGGIPDGRTLGMVMVGVSNAVITSDLLDTELSYEAMKATGSGLGSASFIVVADDVAPVAVAAGVAHFLAIESCGQCQHCKQDGLDIARLLGGLALRGGEMRDLAAVTVRLETVADGARCGLAAQQQVVVGSLLRTFSRTIDAGLATESATGRLVVAALVDLDEHGALLDPGSSTKQPDWTHGEGGSALTPVDRFRDRPATPATL